VSLINWIFDIYQHSKINDAQAEASSMKAELASLRAGGGAVDTERIERALGELALATKALQRTLIERGVCTPDQFAEQLRSIDLEDGERDGQSPI
jgi:hypothetical protein